MTDKKQSYPGRQDYPSNNLPPKRIVSRQMGGSWYLSFEMIGSGVPSILQADCYQVDAGEKVTPTGQLKINPIDSMLYTEVNPVTCHTVPSQDYR